MAFSYKVVSGLKLLHLSYALPISTWLLVNLIDLFYNSLFFIPHPRAPSPKEREMVNYKTSLMYQNQSNLFEACAKAIQSNASS